MICETLKIASQLPRESVRKAALALALSRSISGLKENSMFYRSKSVLRHQRNKVFSSEWAATTGITHTDFLNDATICGLSMWNSAFSEII